MSKEVAIELEGKITDILPGDRFKILLENGRDLMAKVSGKMRMHNIKLVIGDTVKVEVSPYDLQKGRIVYRNKLG